MRQTWPALILGGWLLTTAAALAQFGPGSPGVPPVGQTGPGAPGLPVPPIPPDAPAIPETPHNEPPVPTFSQPKPANAFEGGGVPGDSGPGFCFHVGAIALRRETNGGETIAVFDPGVVLPPFPRFFDHGGGIGANAATALSLSDLSAEFGYGVKASMVFPGEASLFEITGYFVPRSVSNGGASAPAQLNLPFSNSPPPLGFEGDNGLWLQADRVTLTLENQIGNFEMNTHFRSNSLVDFVLGVRYFDLEDSFRIFTDDDGLTISPPDPTTNATYSITSHTRLVGPQVGAQLRIMIDDPDVFLGIGVNAVPGVNFNQVETSLIRGDGFAGPSGKRVQTIFSQLLEFNLSLEFTLTERLWFRAGYQGLVLMNVPVSYEQINFDPGNTAVNVNNKGIDFFHGPTFMVSF